MQAAQRSPRTVIADPAPAVDCGHRREGRHRGRQGRPSRRQVDLQGSWRERRRRPLGFRTHSQQARQPTLPQGALAPGSQNLLVELDVPSLRLAKPGL